MSRGVKRGMEMRVNKKYPHCNKCNQHFASMESFKDHQPCGVTNRPDAVPA